MYDVEHAYYAVVRPSVRPYITQMNRPKPVEVRILQFSSPVNQSVYPSFYLHRRLPSACALYAVVCLSGCPSVTQADSTRQYICYRRPSVISPSYIARIQYISQKTVKVIIMQFSSPIHLSVYPTICQSVYSLRFSSLAIRKTSLICSIDTPSTFISLPTTSNSIHGLVTTRLRQFCTPDITLAAHILPDTVQDRTTHVQCTRWPLSGVHQSIHQSSTSSCISVLTNSAVTVFNPVFILHTF